MVSIIIPVFNNLGYTKKCLQSIFANTKNVFFEIIIVNDASTDGTEEYLIARDNEIKYIKNKSNIGFLKSCNKGASIAEGKYFVFLNNDTIPQLGWLENLVKLAEEDDKIGAVGAKLIYPNGILQEAGGIVFNDGSAMNYGNRDDPNKPEYNYVREVDYCSGACLMVRNNLFQKLGGFDERYSPAYYEDTDLCFSIRKLGYKVMYQPKSVVIHYEGASCGRDLKSGIKKFQNINKEKFIEKWKEELKNQPSYCKERLDEIASHRISGKRILILYPSLPEYDRYSGAFRLINILKILVDTGHKVTFFTDDKLEGKEKYKEKLEELGIMVVIPPISKKGKFISIRKLKRRIFLKKLFTSYTYEIVWFGHYEMGYKYLSLCKKYLKSAKYIVDSVDLHFLREQREAIILNDKGKMKKALRTEKKEISIYKKCDLVIAITDKEKEILKKKLPFTKVETIPNIHSVVKECKNFNERENLLFIGGYKHSPNPDAIEYFCKEIFPLIKKELKNIKFYVVGEYPNEFANKFYDKDVIFIGAVNDTQEYLQKCKVFVASLRFGAGMKGKIGEAMSSGIPVVTTSIGEEGMGLEEYKNVLIGNNPEEFAEKVIRVNNDKNLWEKLAINGKQYIERNFSPEIIKRKIDSIVNNI